MHPQVRASYDASVDALAIFARQGLPLTDLATLGLSLFAGVQKVSDIVDDDWMFNSMLSPDGSFVFFGQTGSRLCLRDTSPVEVWKVPHGNGAFTVAGGVWRTYDPDYSHAAARHIP